MEFSYSDYTIRLVLNPNDIIVRFEHDINKRIWEKTLVERDFIELQALGGLEFVGRLLGLAFTNETEGLDIVDLTESVKTLSFTVQYDNPIIGKPILIPVSLVAIKKEKASADVDDLSRKLKAADSELVLVKEQIQNMSSLYEAMSLRFQELEEMTAGYVVIPGCPAAIPVNTVTLNIGLHSSQNNVTNFNYSSNWTLNCGPEGNYSHNGLTKSLANLRFLKDCTTLILYNFSLVMDYSPIKSMTKLTSLSIVGTPNQCQLTDISWIESLQNLTAVCFFGCNKLTDISPLAKLKNLKMVDLRQTGVSNTALLGSAVTVTR